MCTNTKNSSELESAIHDLNVARVKYYRAKLAECQQALLREQAVNAFYEGIMQQMAAEHVEQSKELANLKRLVSETMF